MNCDMYGLIKKLPPEFKLILDYIKTLDYYQTPNYKVRWFFRLYIIWSLTRGKLIFHCIVRSGNETSENYNTNVLFILIYFDTKIISHMELTVTTLFRSCFLNVKRFKKSS